MTARPSLFSLNPASSLYTGLVWDGLGYNPGSDTMYSLSNPTGNGTLTNFADPAAAWSLDGTLGRYCVDFTAASTHFVSGPVLSSLSGDCTLFCWVNLDINNTGAGMVDLLKSDAADGGAMRVDYVGRGLAYYSPNTSWKVPGNDYDPDPVIPTGTWKPIAVVVDADVGVVIYYGDVTYTFSDTTAGITTPTTALKLAKSYGGIYMDGRIADAMVWSRAISSAEFAKLKDPDNTMLTDASGVPLLLAGHPAIKRFGGVPFAAVNRGVW